MLSRGQPFPVGGDVSKPRLVAAAPVLTLGVALALTGCNGSEPETEELPELSESSSPAETKSASPLDRIPTAPPQAPRAARSDAGAKAFARHVVDMYWYTYLTTDPKPLFALDLNNTCGSCRETRKIVREVRQEGYAQIPDEPVSVHDVKVVAKTGPFRTVALQTDISAGKQVDRETGEVLDTLGPRPNDYMEIELKWQGGRWALQNYRFPDDGGTA